MADTDIGRELCAKVKSVFDSRIAGDTTIAAIRRKVEDGRATMNDMSVYSRQLGMRLRQAIESTIRPEDLPGETMYQNIAHSILDPLLRENYDEVNRICAEVQHELDRKARIGLTPQAAEYPAERVTAASFGAAAKELASDAIKVLGRTSENITASASDEYMKTNAEYRSKAGLDAYIVRTDSAGCCKWCAALAGKYKYPDEIPDDIFRRHDNCTCDVSYVSEKGRRNVHTQQLNWSKEKNLEYLKQLDAEKKAKRAEYKANGKTLQKVRFKPSDSAARRERIEYAAGVPKPMKLTRAEAQALESKLIASKPGKNDNAIADMKFINSQAFADKFKGKYENEQVEQAVVKACRQVVKNRNGTFFEEAFFIDAQTGRTVSYVKGKKKNGVEMSEELKKHLTNAREKSIIMIHNHPNSSPLSRADYLTSSSYKSCYETIAVGHNGDVYSFRDTFETQGKFLGYFVEDNVEYPYYEAIRDYRVAYSKYTSRGQDDFQARNSAWEDVSRMRGFIYEKR